MTTNVRFTQYINTKGSLGKVLNFDGENFKKKTYVNLSKATFITQEMPWNEFGNFVSNLTHNDPISPSICSRTNGNDCAVEGGYIIPKEMLLKGKSGGKGTDAHGHEKLTLDRSKENFIYHTENCPAKVNHNLFYLDIDDMSVFETELDINLSEAPTGVKWSDHVEDCLDKIIIKIYNDLPQLKNLKDGVWAIPSAGALCFETATGRALTGLTGIHIYGLLPVQNTIGQLQKYVDDTLWQAGYGYFALNKIGSANSRTYIDASTLTNNRLDFIGGAKCVGEITQMHRTPVYYDNIYFDKANTLDLDVSGNVWELQQLKSNFKTKPAFLKEQAEKKGKAAETLAVNENISKETALKAIEKLSNGIIPGSVSIRFDNGSLDENEVDKSMTVKVWRVLLNPKRYHEITATDPTRPDKGENKAQLYYNEYFAPGDEWESTDEVNAKGDKTGKTTWRNKQADERREAGVVGGLELLGMRNSSVVMHSFLSGGKLLRLQFDFESLMEMVHRMEETELVERLGSDWMQIFSAEGITDSERKEVFKLIQNKRKERREESTISDIKEQFDVNCQSHVTAEVDAVLNKINRDFFMMFGGGKARVFYEKRVPWGKTTTLTFDYIPTNQFNLKCNKSDYDCYEWKKGIAKKVNIAEQWQNWDGRIDFEGFTFSPEGEKVVKIRHKGVESRYYNLFQGYSVKKKGMGERACKGENCGGKGCINWFFTEGYKGCKWEGVCESDKTSDLDQYKFKGRMREGVMLRGEYDGWGCGYDSGYGFQGCGIIWWLRATYENLCSGDLELTKWMVRWVSDLLKNPGKRPGTALVSRGGMGVGKGMFINPVSKMVEEYFLHTSNMRDIVGRFNAHLQSLLLVFADEAVFGGSKEMASTLKAMVTEDSLNIEKKGIDKFRAVNHIRLYISSNNAWVVPADEDERRYCVVNCWSGHKQDREFFRRVSATKYQLGEMLEELLLSADDKDVSPKTPITENPDTEGLRDQKNQNMTIEQELLTEIKTKLKFDGDFEGDEDWISEGNNILERIRKGYPVRSAQMLTLLRGLFRNHHDMQYMTQNKLTSRLKQIWTEGTTFKKYKLNCSVGGRRVDESSQNGWRVDNVSQFVK